MILINNLNSRYGIGFDSRSYYLIANVNWGKNVIVFDVDNSSSAHADNTKNEFSIIRLNILLKLEDQKICLSLHYNKSNSGSYVNGVKIYQFIKPLQ